MKNFEKNLARLEEITRKMAYPRRLIPVEDYETYKADVERIAYSSKQKIFLEKQEIKNQPTPTEEKEESSLNTKDSKSENSLKTTKGAQK